MPRTMLEAEDKILASMSVCPRELNIIMHYDRLFAGQYTSDLLQ